jgi:hypothetical protein
LSLHHEIGVALNQIGELCRMERRPREAEPYYREGYLLYRKHGLDTTNFHFNLSIVANEAKDYSRARDHLSAAALESRRQLGEYYKCWLPHHAAALAGAIGDSRFAARMWGAAAFARSTNGLVLHGADVEFFESRIQRSRADLGADEFERAFEKGFALSLDEAQEEIRTWLESHAAKDAPGNCGS